MIVLNFSHLTAEQLHQLEKLTGEKVDRVVEVDARIDPQQPIVPQVIAMADRAGLNPQEWQTLPIIVLSSPRPYSTSAR